MARVAVANQDVVAGGLEATFTNATGDDQEFDNDTGQRTFIWVKNADGSDHDVTIITPGTIDGNAVADLTVTVTAGEERLIGPFPAGVYNQADNTVQIDYSATTGMSCAVITLEPR